MKSLLVCTDGSFPYTESCFNYAAWLMQKTHTHANVLYVSDSRQFDISMLADLGGSLGAQPYNNLYTQLQNIEEEKIRVIRSNTERFFKERGLLDRITFCQQKGSLIDAYQSFENSAIGVDLVILGKRGENANFDTEHLGTSMERLVRTSKRPCWVAARSFIPIKNILIAYDGSPSVHQAIQFLLRTKIFKDLSITLLTVCPDEASVAESTQSIKSVEKALSDAKYQVNSFVLSGDVSDIIANFTVQKHIDLLIMGAYGHSAIRHLLIGSTTTDLIRRCKISVLLFR